MLRKAYGYNDEFFMFDQLDTDILVTSARNVEILVWRLKNNRQPAGNWQRTHTFQGVYSVADF